MLLGGSGIAAFRPESFMTPMRASFPEFEIAPIWLRLPPNERALKGRRSRNRPAVGIVKGPDAIFFYTKHARCRAV